MTIEQVRRFCLSLPSTTETVQWANDLVFKIGGKMYAVVGLEPGEYFMSFKCSPEKFTELLEREEFAPAPYLARASWVALRDADALRPAEWQPLLKRAYELVLERLPKKTRDTITASAAARPSRGGRTR